MKKLIIITCSLLILLCACQTDDMFGTAVITLPAGTAARSSTVTPEFIDTLTFRIECEKQGEKTVIRDGLPPGSAVQISLLAGEWLITVKVFNAAGIEIGKTEMNVDIKAGVSTPIPDINIQINPIRCDITYFAVTEPVMAVGVIDEDTILIEVPLDTDVTNLKVNVIHEGKEINPDPQDGLLDFSIDNGIKTFRVTAEDNEYWKDYTVIVTGAYRPEITTRDITAFIITNPVPKNVVGIIENNNITVTVPFETVLTQMSFEIYHNGKYVNGASLNNGVSPATGTADFTYQQEFTVTSDNDWTKTYTVTVKHATSHFKDLTQFLITTPEFFVGEINKTDANVNIIVPYGTDVSEMTFTANHTGFSIDPPSGSTIDLTTPKQITITALDGSTKTYTVAVEYFHDTTLHGDGQEGTPFQIFTEEQLKMVGTEPVGVGNWSLEAFYILMDDITLSPAAVLSESNWTPIGTNENRFTGTFNGNDKIISNLYISSVTGNKGMFGYIGSEGVVKNLTLENVIINVTGTSSAGGDNIGIIAANNYGLIDKCIVKGFITSSGFYVGGLVGRNIDASAIVKNSNTSVLIMGNNGENIGGVVGTLSNGAQISNSHSTRDISGRGLVGGVVGSTTGSSNYIDGCSAIGNVTGTENSIGGVLGRASISGTVRNCFATGYVSGTSAVGGVVGSIGNTNFVVVEYCYSTGDVSGGTAVGGVVGNLSNSTSGGSLNSPFVRNCYSTGNISGNTQVGGIAGQVDYVVTIQYCYASGNISGNSGVGGIAGGHTWGINNSIQNSVALNLNINATDYTPGRVGGNSSRLTFLNCFARSDMLVNDATISAGTGPTTMHGQSLDVWDAAFWNGRGFSGPWWEVEGRLPIGGVE